MRFVVFFLLGFHMCVGRVVWGNWGSSSGCDCVWGVDFRAGKKIDFRALEQRFGAVSSGGREKKS